MARAIVFAAPGAGSLWADLCKPSDAEEGGGCEEVVTSQFGYVAIPWPTVVASKPPADEEGTASAVSTRWVAHSTPTPSPRQFPRTCCRMAIYPRRRRTRL